MTAASLAPGTVVGLGDPVLDIIARVDAEWLCTVAPEPGGCLPVPPGPMAELVSSASKRSELTRIPGGSAANVLKGIANIAGAAVKCKFVGMIGQDDTGREYKQKLAQQGVEPLLLESTSGAPSACAMCLVTPDGQRTMRTCLGASLELNSSSQLPSDWTAGCRLLHAEGYCLYRPQLARDMFSAARASGATTSIDLASFELVRNCRESLLGLLQDGLIDLIFANEEESITLATELGLAPQEAGNEVLVSAAQSFLLRHVKVAVTSLGARGCVARGAGGESGEAPACRVQVVDTIGAGDFFTAGFLSAYLQGGSLLQCCSAGCASGCEAVQATGAELDPAAFGRLRASLATILGTCAAGSGASPALPRLLQQGGSAAAATSAAAKQQQPVAVGLLA